MRDWHRKRCREGDSVIDGRIGNWCVCVFIDCGDDERRLAHPAWVDATKAEHDRLDSNALLLASGVTATRN
jgi:hypothetical protein